MVAGQKNYRKQFQRSGAVGKRTTEPGRQDNSTSESRPEHELPHNRDRVDSLLGFERYSGLEPRVGWLLNMHATEIQDSNQIERSAIDLYLIEDDGATFKTTLIYAPYFLVACKENREGDVEEYLRRKFERSIEQIERIRKEDLDLSNHLVGLQRMYLKLIFRTVDDLLEVRRVIMPAVKKNLPRIQMEQTYNDQSIEQIDEQNKNIMEGLDFIIDIREYDVPFLARVAIDLDLRVGLWYIVQESKGKIVIKPDSERVLPAEPVVLAFDIETTKAPLKFPDASIDQVMMISYMIDNQGYLITNREIVSEDLDDFDYSPRPGEYDGPFIIFNECDEQSLLRRFFEHIKEVHPGVFVTYNGDFFDWPFIDFRSKIYGMDLFSEIGFFKNSQNEYNSWYAPHLDCFKWVQRDSYLPVGSQGLKAVTKYKLGYDPKELDPELMTPYAAECPSVLADYSVSDAVATYYLYMKYVHPFIFSLCNIIPLGPDDVLRKGSGTLCEMLLMVEAYKANVIMPNKHVNEKGKFFEGHLLESETYVGGHVEALESGVFRSDLSTEFRLDPLACEQLIEDVDKALRFSIEVEEKKDFAQIKNYSEIRQSIIDKLQHLRDNPVFKDTPMIYHLDVAAMYPNIILTNRLQPPAIVSEEVCAACDFNKPGSDCQRKMTWSWRGEFFPADRREYNMIINQLENESFPAKAPNEPARSWSQLPSAERHSLIQKRLSNYSRKVYKKIHESKVETKESIVCQRENSFYVDTVRNFRDRRYEYKTKLKVWKKKFEQAQQNHDPSKIDESKKMIVLMDSLQLAHKCILNSFYGYVMRKGSRWYSMEMAGIVCLTGANIIMMARQLIERIGRPLELDTDGIWCILPRSFPENFTFELEGGAKFTISYPGVMLNHLVHAKFTNHQYQDLIDPAAHKYAVRSENSIFFEVDGPYRAMILPASKEENKLLKKRYAVFNEDGSLAELKGFEMKRRGELKIIKIFQEEVFRKFLLGGTLEECYSNVAEVANRWLDLLFSRGKSVTDDELLDYISENRSMSKTLEDYGTQKSTSISTAKRLAEFLGDQMVKDKGLACKFVIAEKPYDAPVTERAIPVAIFSAELSVKRHFLRKWLRDNSLNQFDVRSILDWDYYIERLGSTVQKLVTIPASMQNVRNPVPRIVHPDWLLKRATAKNDLYRQKKITDMFKPIPKDARQKIISFQEDVPFDDVMDIEEMGSESVSESAVRKQKGPSISHKKSITTEIVIESKAMNFVTAPPDYSKNYVDWISYRKVIWMERLKNRKLKVDGEVDDATDTLPLVNGDISTFYQRQNRQLLRSDWEIIHISATNVPGEFRLWAIIGGQMQSVKLSVPRVFYVNCREPDQLERFTKSAHMLPRSHQSINLYEFSITERQYQEDDNLFKNFSWHHDTVGVYETRMPLIFRALLQLGSTIKPNLSKPGVSSKTLEDTFDLTDFIRKDLASNQRYLDGRRLNIIFFYHANTDSRHVFGVFIDDRLKVFVVDPFGNDQMPNLDRLYQERRQQKAAEGESDAGIILNYPVSLEYSFNFYQSEKDALKAVQKTLLDYEMAKRGPTAVISQSSRTFDSLVGHIHALQNYPIICMPSGTKDNSFPPLDWQRYAARRMIQSYCYANDWFWDRILVARYSNVPIGNIDNDTTTFLSDLFYARNLNDRQLVLWYSSTERPDLGGHEDDDNYYVLEETVDPEVNVTGSYGTICVEYQLSNLPMNTILQSGFINDLEDVVGSDLSFGGSGLDAESKKMKASMEKEFSSSIIDPNNPSMSAFRCLKEIVKGWSKECLIKRNPFAEMMLGNFYRWISSSSSRMHDPSLYIYLHGLMKKVLMQLLAEFRRLGSKIVFANFNKIIIVTTKTSIENAQAYNDFVLKTIRAKDVFFFIDLKPLAYWEHLVWFDSINYGGIITTGRADDYDRGDDDGPEVVMEWNVCNYLPPLVQQYFTGIVAEFILRIRELNVEKRSGSKFSNSKATSSQKSGIMEDSERKQTLIRQHFTRKLLEIIPSIQRKLNSIMETDEELAMISFPQLPGSHQMDNPALELIKFVCQIFNLEPDLQNDVRIMRRALLNLIGIKEFSKYAEFENPCESFIMRHVICQYCQFCRDVNLSVDILTESENESSWICCTNCGQEYEKGVIEELLIHMIQKTLMAYQLQDLNCRKCRAVKVENLRDHCKSCASAFDLSGINTYLYDSTADSIAKPGQNFQRKLEVLRSIADMQDMKCLRQLIATLDR